MILTQLPVNNDIILCLGSNANKLNNHLFFTLILTLGLNPGMFTLITFGRKRKDEVNLDVNK